MTNTCGCPAPPAPVPGVVETSRLYGDGVMTPADLVETILRRPLEDGSFIRVTADEALRDATRATSRLHSGHSFGPLDGLSVAIKDCIDVAGVCTTNGSLVAKSTTPASADAGIVRMLRQQGAVVVGKTNLSELAFSGIGLNPHFGSPVNPLSRSRVTGGSSSGSAAAVAAGHVALAVGTDTSGSVRVPAAFCGIVGYKASEGRFPLDGIRPLSPTLDSVGILTRTVADLRTAMDTLAPSPVRSGRVRPPDRTVLVVPDDEIVTACEPDVRAWFTQQVDELDRLADVVVEVRRMPVLAETQALMDDHGTVVAADAYALYGSLLLGPTADRLDAAVARRLRTASSLKSGIEVVRRSMPTLRNRLAHELDGALLLCPTVRHRPPLVTEVTAGAAAFDEINAQTLRTTMLL
ncbi:MAG: amidase family protein, partial [Nocardioides sp.]